MKMSNLQKQELEYIVNRVKREYPTEKAFYEGKLSQMSWTRLKNGESSLDNLTRKSWESIASALFSDYEYTIFKSAKQSVQLNMADNLEKEYNRLRIKHAKYIMNNGGHATVDSARMVVTGNEPDTGTRFKIEDELGNTLIFGINIPSHQVPSGKKNRLEWFNKNFGEDILK